MKELEKKEVDGIKRYLKGLTTKEFRAKISNVQTVVFNALSTGTKLEARP